MSIYLKKLILGKESGHFLYKGFFSYFIKVNLQSIQLCTVSRFDMSYK